MSMSPKVYEIDGIVPVIDKTAFVHPDAILIGDVIVGPGVYVGPACCLRGDFGRLVLEEGSNIQDTCVMHGFPGTDTVVEKNGHIGHGAVLHGCVIGEDALVGMNAVIMDGAVIGPECIVAASAFVRAGMKFDRRTLIGGMPAKVMRQLSDEEFAWKQAGTKEYQDLTIRSLKSMKPAVALSEVEENRARVPQGGVKPLFETKT
ncbi:phenylacetic acid degradation protein PaaY [Terasakiella pusilla]|uniref:phenylacetic acid degradation protein PaaY n=1 Tax=Terasakiella pusilla TaxID=64973 RepID=UPI00056E4C00|nr:phenylacetic acid degradation protein PaaY [Terasakiella pusilla]